MKNKNKNPNVIAGIVGLVLNVLLGAFKLFAGILSGSISVMSDAANNLSDAGNSGLATLSFNLSGKKADKGHPYGHGRYEYIAALIVSILIIVTGVEFLRGSVTKIIGAQKSSAGVLVFAVLSVSVAVKFLMSVLYSVFSKKHNSDVLKALRFDSLSDCLVTGLVIISLIIERFTGFVYADALGGILVSAFIIFGGLKLIGSTTDKLLGHRADPELIKKVCSITEAGDHISGTHDLMVHDYGAGNMFASIHAEFDSPVTMEEAHEIVDALEKRAKEELGLTLVIHCDPADKTDGFVSAVKKAIAPVLSSYEDLSAHDILPDGESGVKFDINLPEPLEKAKIQIESQLKNAVKQKFPYMEVTIGVDIV